MAFKKFIHKNGKRYGPYIYHNQRINGKVVTNYLGKKEKDRRNLFYALTFIALIALSLAIMFHVIYPTGRVVLDLEEITLDSEAILGKVRLILNQGELIPYNSIIKINLNEQNLKLSINSVVNREKESGVFYIENTNLDGQGEGFGIKGTKTSYPVVYFRLKIEKTTKSSELDVGIPEDSEEIPETEEPTDEKNSDLVTSQTIVSDFADGQVTSLVDFEYELESGESASLISGSVNDGNKTLSDDIVSLIIENNVAKVSTDYVIEEQGFGPDYTDGEEIILEIDFFEFNITPEQGILSVEVTYDNHSLLYGEKNIVIKDEIYGIPPIENISEPSPGEIIEKEIEEPEEEISEEIAVEAEANITEEAPEEEIIEKEIIFGAQADKTSSLTLWDDADTLGGFQVIKTNETAGFYAKYFSNDAGEEGKIILDANCNITFDDGQFVMNTGAYELWNYTYSSTSHETTYDLDYDNQTNTIVWVGTGNNLTGEGGSSGKDWNVKKFNSSGTELWNFTWGYGRGAQDLSRGVAVDNNSNIIVVGSGYNLTGPYIPASHSYYDWHVKKLNASGTELWQYNWTSENFASPTSTWDEAYAVAVDANGDIIVGGAGYNLSGTVPYSSEYDWHIKKFNSSGYELWNFTWGNSYSSTYDYLNDITLDNNSNIYAVGFSNNVSCPVNCGSSSYDWHVKKLNASGTELWQYNWTARCGSNDQAYSIMVDNNSNLYVAGYAYNLTSDVEKTAWDWHLKKLNASTGEELWNYSFASGGNINDKLKEVKLDEDGNIILMGDIYNLTGQGTDNEEDWHVKKLNASGYEIWNYTLEFTNQDYLGAGIIDSLNRIIIAGHIKNLTGYGGDSNADAHIKTLEEYFNYERTFDKPGLHNYSVACNSTDYEENSQNDTIFINIGCGTQLTVNATLTENLYCNGSAITLLGNNIILDCNLYSIIGDDTGTAINITSNSTTLKNCVISNFVYGLYTENTSYNVIYNNYFEDNAINAYDNATNYYNTTYSYIPGSLQSIIGGDSIGGNYWDDYFGLDNSNAILTFVPNVSGDDIGDTELPHNSSNNIRVGGDYLPLISSGCDEYIDSCKTSNWNNNTVYCLNQTITTSSSCMVVNNNSVSINCMNYQIRGDGDGGDYGVYTNYDNLSVNDCKILGFGRGIYYENDNEIISQNLIFNNTHGIYIKGNNSGVNNNEIINNTIGISIESAFGNIVYSNNITNNTNFGIQIIDSSNNTIYNNYFNNTINAYDNSSSGNNWNISKTAGSNIYGGNYLAGNYWYDYNGLDTGFDGLGDTLLPYNSTNNISVGGDHLPLLQIIDGCNFTTTLNLSLEKNLDCDGIGLIVGDNDLIIDCNEYSIIGNGSGIGINISNFNNTIIKNCNINNFTYGTYIIGGLSNTIYNNWFNNTINAHDESNNFYNITYSCSPGSNQNILGGDCIGGNFWNLYNGTDTLDDEVLDGIGKTEILPHNGTGILNGGDHLPLVYLTDCDYNLTTNLTLFQDVQCLGNKNGFQINISDINLTCSGHSIIGDDTVLGLDGDYGVYALGTTGTITNCTISNFTSGVYFNTASKGNISHNYFDNNKYGVYFYRGSKHVIHANNLHDNNHAIYFYWTANNNITSNRIINNSMGFEQNDFPSSGHIFYNNYFDNNLSVVYNYQNSGLDWNTTYSCSLGSRQNILGGDCMGGNYWSNYAGLDDGSGGRIGEDGIGDTNIPYSDQGVADYLPLLHVNVTCDYYLSDCKTSSWENSKTYCLSQAVYSNDTCMIIDNDDIGFDCRGLLMSGNLTPLTYAMNISERNNVSISDCLIANFSSAIYLFNSTNISIDGSSLFNNSFAGIEMVGSYENKIYNTIINFNSYGVVFNSSSLNNLTLNTVNNNSLSNIFLNNLSNNNYFNSNSFNDAYDGIYVMGKYNVFIENDFMNNTNTGIYLTNCLYNNFSRNNVINNSNYGIYVVDSNNNLIHDNYFNNTINAYDNSSSGNYWNSSYSCSAGSSQNIGGGDCFAGNLWLGPNGYEGNDSDFDAVGDTELPYNSSNNIWIGGDYLPLIYNPLSCNYTINETTFMSMNLICLGNNGLIIGNDNITLDCRGHTIRGNSDDPFDTDSLFGVSINDKKNITIKNCTIENFYRGIDIENANNSFILHNSFIDNYLAINLDKLSNISINFNNINSYTGAFSIYAYTMEHTNISYNFFNNTNCVNLYQNSLNNTLYNNYFYCDNQVIEDSGSFNNSWNISYSCSWGSRQNILGDSCMGGNYWRYYSISGFDDGSNGRIAEDGIGDTNFPYPAARSYAPRFGSNGDFLPLVSIDCDFYIDDCKADGWWEDRVYCLNKSISTTETCFNITGNNSIILNCRSHNITGDGDLSDIGIISQNNNTIIQNCEIYNFGKAIFLNKSFNNSLISNILEDNQFGLVFLDSSNNSINDTDINNNSIGISIESAFGNIVYSNNITNNTNFGIQIIGSSNNTIYNNYFSNTINAYDNSSLGNNWNISKTAGSSIIGGSFLGGNFWHDYLGEDTDGDTIGNNFLPYNSSNNISIGGDYLPLKISQYGDGGTTGGGGGAGCTSIWSCGQYGDCIGDYKERTCRDIKNCLTPTNIPAGCIITTQATCVQKEFCGEEEVEEVEEVEEEICSPDWTCEGYGECQSDGFKYPLNCVDINDCGTSRGKPEPIPCECTPVLECGDWKECRIDYNMDNLVAGQYVEIEGIQKRDCYDSSGCIDYPIQEEQACIVDVPIEIKEKTSCEETIIEVYNQETQELVSRIRETNNLSGVHVNFIETSQEGYCNYCFNGIQDYDETDVDCGGPNCPSCTTEYLDNFVLVKSFILATGSMATFFIVYNLIRSLAVSAAEQAVASAAMPA